MLRFVFHRTIVHGADTAIMSGSVSSFLCELFDIYSPKRYLRLAKKLVIGKFHCFFVFFFFFKNERYIITSATDLLRMSAIEMNCCKCSKKFVSPTV